MTRKDFELIARVLRYYKEDMNGTSTHVSNLAHRFATELEQTNPRFDRRTFFDACTVKDTY